MSEKYQAYGYYLEDLQNQLDTYRRRRNWLMFLWVSWIVIMIIGASVLTFTVISTIVLVLIAVSTFLPLLYHTMRHSQMGEALEDEVRRLPYRQLTGDFEKPKRDGVDYDQIGLGADGELVEIDEEDDSARRLSL
jgi:Mn2+/Fe2+ NRAMP family transporter